jgi:hypothetical protein
LKVSLLMTALLVFPWFIPGARACTCMEYGTPPCVAYRRADAVFVGLIAEISKPQAETGSTYEYVTVRFLVEERFRGVAGSEIEILTSSNTSCDLGIKRGERWLVYARRETADGKLAMGACTRTHQVDGDDDDLIYLRGLSKGIFEQAVLGKMLEDRYTPLGGIKISVEGGGHRYETTADAEGNYKVALAKPGTYTVQAIIPFSAGIHGYDLEGIKQHPTDEQTVIDYRVDIPEGLCDYREINVVKIDLHATAEITGTVLDESERPITDGFVNLLKADESSAENSGKRFSRIDSEGKYKFEGLPSGRYILVINPEPEAPTENAAPYPRTYYPGVSNLSQATVISVTEGAKLGGLDFHMGSPFKERPITGQVVWTDNRPVEGALVALYDGVTHNYLYLVKTDSKGRFQLKGYENFKYEITAEINGDIRGRGKRMEVPATGKLKPFKLVIKPEP